MNKVNEELVKGRRHEVLKNLSRKKEVSESIFQRWPQRWLHWYIEYENSRGLAWRVDKLSELKWMMPSKRMNWIVIWNLQDKLWFVSGQNSYLLLSNNCNSSINPMELGWSNIHVENPLIGWHSNWMFLSPLNIPNSNRLVKSSNKVALNSVL